VGQALLLSTDLDAAAQQIVTWYKARFQSEFLFRDGKQFTGLADCQARRKEALHTHLHAALTALNVIQLEDRRHKATAQPTVISMASWRRRKAHEQLMKRLFERLGLDRSAKNVRQAYDELRNYGTIAA
jgi:hypothetical protein